MAKKFRDVQGFVFDFDGVFYAYKFIPGGLNSLCDNIMAKTATALLKSHGLTLTLAKRLAHQGYEDHGDAITCL